MIRRAALVAAVVGILVGGGMTVDRLFHSHRPPPIDFAAFWTAGGLNARGENPYDPARVRAVEREIGLNADAAVMIWYPPWVLTLVMPFGLFPFAPAYAVWALVHIGLVIASAELLWRGLTPPAAPKHRKRRWVAYLIALTFVPTTYLIGIGQITGVVLAGLAGFLVLARNGRPLLAGMAGAVTATKPHLLTVFAALLVLEAVAGRGGRRIVLGGAVVGLLACLPATLANPDVWQQYLHTTTAPADDDHYLPSNWATPVIACWVRLAIPGQPFWVQFVPPVAAVLGFTIWYLTRGKREHNGKPDWAGLLPWIVGVSMLTAPYGAWPFDLVLLLVPILAAAARVAANPNPAAVAVGVAWLAAVNAVLLAMMLDRTSSEMYVWTTPTVLVGCLLTARLSARPARSVRVAPPPLVPAGV